MLLSQSLYFVTCIAVMTPRQLLVSLASLTMLVSAVRGGRPSSGRYDYFPGLSLLQPWFSGRFRLPTLGQLTEEARDLLDEHR
jgi:hypothetical protein